jgi:1,4-dihydroxy-2-naphthoate octaprenyltransferase
MTAGVKLWVLLARPAFQSVGLLPFVVGIALAVHNGYSLVWPVAVLGSLAVFLIMLSTYYLGEYYDFEGDCLNTNRNPFSGGTGVLPAWADFPRHQVLAAGYLAAILAVIVGLTLHFKYGVGMLALILGGIGLIGGVFYSAKPLQWAYRGIGEALIGFCYGWLTVNMGYYVLAGHISWLGTLISLPVVLSITAVILINEFPDQEADARVGKKNLVVRFGPRLMARLYVFLIGATVFTAGLASWQAHGLTWPWVGGVTGLTTIASFAVWGIARNRHLHVQTIQPICAGTIILNQFTCLYYLWLFGLS